MLAFCLDYHSNNSNSGWLKNLLNRAVAKSAQRSGSLKGLFHIVPSFNRGGVLLREYNA
jgi:hypothetical protein